MRANRLSGAAEVFHAEAQNPGGARKVQDAARHGQINSTWDLEHEGLNLPQDVILEEWIKGSDMTADEAMAYALENTDGE